MGKTGGIGEAVCFLNRPSIEQRIELIGRGWGKQRWGQSWSVIGKALAVVRHKLGSWLLGIQTIPAGDLPQHQRVLLDAHNALLREAMAIVAPAMQRARQGPGNFAICAIFNRLLRMARAVETMCRLGYADVAESVARSMVNAAVDIIFLAEHDTNQRSLLYGLYSRERRRRRARSLVDHGYLRQDQADAWDQRQTQQEEASLAQHAATGVEPTAKLGARPTWHGLTDDQMMRRVGRGEWYDLYYVPFSDAAHANVVGTRIEMQELVAGAVNIGPRFEDLPTFIVTMASADIVSRSLYELDRYFTLGLEQRIQQVQRTIFDAINRFNAVIAPNLPNLSL